MPKFFANARIKSEVLKR